MGIVGIHPAISRKSVEAFDSKRVVKRSLCEERTKSRTVEESFNSPAVGGLRMRILCRMRITPPTPLFFVSVASK